MAAILKAIIDIKMKIYSKTGDCGVTKLCDGKEIAKDSAQIKTCGMLDELNSFLGLVGVYCQSQSGLQKLGQQLHRIQQEIVRINSELALASGAEIITMHEVEILEQEIDAMTNSLPPLTNFVVPGGNEVSAHLHIARTVCRRAETELATLAKTTTLNAAIMPYLNRLSDWLFMAARITMEKS